MWTRHTRNASVRSWTRSTKGALFLTAGDSQDAEWLLVETVGDAFYEDGPDSTYASRWFEARLAQRFLLSTAAPEPTDPGLVEVGPVPELQPVDLFRAAAAVPSWARAALWLVLLQAVDLSGCE